MMDTFVPDWLLDRVIAHDGNVLALDVGLLGDLSLATEFGQRCEAAGVQLLGSVSLDLDAASDRWEGASISGNSACFDPTRAGPLKTGWLGSSEMAIFDMAMAICQAAGISVLSLIHGQPGRSNRYVGPGSVANRLARMQSNVSLLIPRAEALGLTLALEPHMDYRSTELLQVVEAIGSPTLRLIFDFSDPLSVNEDPLDAARHVAPYVAAVHIRDMRVQALTEIATGAFFHAPLGEGNVPLLEMLQVINDSASSGSSLPCCLKVVARPEHDVEHWLEASIEWLRTRSSVDWF
jgi:sugar phosphate isomerase/epimerase